MMVSTSSSIVKVKLRARLPGLREKKMYIKVLGHVAFCFVTKIE